MSTKDTDESDAGRAARYTVISNQIAEDIAHTVGEKVAEAMREAGEDPAVHSDWFRLGCFLVATMLCSRFDRKPPA